VNTLCRDCSAFGASAALKARCDACGSPRLVHHRELGLLSIAHVDCDAFYATVEKRDRPELADRPVIIGGGAITLKLKTADFRLRTRSRRVVDPTQLADTLFQTASGLLAAEADGVTRFRLIGVGADHLSESRGAGPPHLFDRQFDGPRRLELAVDEIHKRLGEGSVQFGRNLDEIPKASRAKAADL
jgi:hypothetical protein